ncbi:3-demethylubiquinol 3-O-methyltransferase [Photobacterium aphoticum]|uniref:3-demethylubiquinol 3-O-methyltransferase n=1 Tax=Photobacterium aphoticum TaxID=754436 RepID=A0A090QPH3_9GAMM|nr:3-demethylubiquinol 3-O-methyltransferase [Photobacterium aphoticum]
MTKQLNVDPAEISKFEDMASRWWDLEGEFKPLHQINPLRLNFVIDHADACSAKKCWMSAVVAGSWQKAWR